MNQQGMIDLRIRAHHEAGHCWGLLQMRPRFRYTTLRPRTSGFDGLTVLYRRWDFDEAYPLAVVAVCGPLAELIYRSSQSADQSPEADASHLREIANGGHDDIPKCRMLQDSDKLAELRSVMNAHWDGISLVAEELLEGSTLSGRRVFEVLDAMDPGAAENP